MNKYLLLINICEVLLCKSYERLACSIISLMFCIQKKYSKELHSIFKAERKQEEKYIDRHSQFQNMQFETYTYFKKQWGACSLGVF